MHAQAGIGEPALAVTGSGAPPDQALRLSRFRKAHPEAEIILPGPWQAVITEPDGKGPSYAGSCETGTSLTGYPQPPCPSRMRDETAVRKAACRQRMRRRLPQGQDANYATPLGAVALFAVPGR